MQSAKTMIGLIGALIPVAFCGGLYLYFQAYSDSPLGMLTGGPGAPTMVGLGAFGLLCCVPLVYKILKLVAAARISPAPKDRADAALEADEPAFDANAALERYLARKAAGGAEVVSPDATPLDPVAPRPSFGRKVG